MFYLIIFELRTSTLVFSFRRTFSLPERPMPDKSRAFRFGNGFRGFDSHSIREVSPGTACFTAKFGFGSFLKNRAMAKFRMMQNAESTRAPVKV